jgi:predicted transcriptional regulator
MSRKELVLNAFTRLPDDCTFEDMTEKLRFLAAIQEGIDQLDRGEGISHEEVKRESASWLST